jgi:acetylornithine deacetylase/succinyl-diaminopimelate desuccinylase-like protein
VKTEETIDMAAVPAERVAQSVSTERVVELATRMCSLPSPLGSEGALAEYVAGELRASGARVHVDTVVAGRPNVITRVKGTGTRAPLILNGHLDATVYPDRWSRDARAPWVEDGRLYGGGITDMIGAVACMLAATEAAAALGELPGDLIFQAVMHHDGTGLGTKYALASDPPPFAYAVCGEPSGMAVHTGNGGALKFEIELRGETQHISRSEEATDTLPSAVDLYHSLGRHSFRHEPHARLPELPRLLVGELTAGSGGSHVAEQAVLRGDLRTVPGMTRDAVNDELTARAEAACRDGVTASVRITSGHQPFIGQVDGPLVEAIQNVHRQVRGADVRITNELPGQAFVTDAADLARAGLETVIYGPGEWRHGPDEGIDVDELVDAARIYLALALSDFGRRAG